MVVIIDDDIVSLFEECSWEIEVLEFVFVVDVDLMMFDCSYFLEFDLKLLKLYVLLVKIFVEIDWMVIVYFMLCNKIRLVVLCVKDFGK